ncbi:DUF559 domain-containing protein [Promicromonospora xylanilytica]
MSTPPHVLALRRIARQLHALKSGEAVHARFFSADNAPPAVPPALPYDKATRPSLATAAQAEEVLRVRRGVYVAPSPSDRAFDADFLAHVRGVVDALHTEFWVCGTAAARLHGLWTYRDPGLVHIVQTYNPPIRIEGRLRRHWSRTLPARDRTTIGDVPVTTLERTIVDVACSAPLAGAVVIVTAGFRAGADPAVVAQLLDERAGTRGVVQARKVMELCDPDCASPGEVLVRLAAILAGLPEPRVQVPVEIPGGTAWLDVGWPAIKAGLEFDGAVKFSGLFGDPLTARRRQASRASGVGQAGWHVESVVWDETVEFQDLQDRISAFYRRAAARLAPVEPSLVPA